MRAKGNAWGVVGWSIGNGWCVLLLPTIFAALGPNTLHIFGGVNVLSIIVVWALYPETNQRKTEFHTWYIAPLTILGTLEEMNLVFASDSIWNWDAEKNFAILKEENPELVQAARRGSSVVGDAGRRSSGFSAEKGESRKASLVAGER